MLRLAVLVSGGGTNLQAILDAIDEGTITNAEVSVVISNNAGAYALERAKRRRLMRYAFPRRPVNREKHSTRHCWRNRSRTTSISLCSAGCLVVIPRGHWMLIRIRSSTFIRPSFVVLRNGLLRTESARGRISRGVKVTGATVLLWTAEQTTGPIILQKAVEVHEGDTPKALSSASWKRPSGSSCRVRLISIANGKVMVEDGHVKIKE